MTIGRLQDFFPKVALAKIDEFLLNFTDFCARRIRSVKDLVICDMEKILTFVTVVFPQNSNLLECVIWIGLLENMYVYMCVCMCVCVCIYI